MKTMRPRLVVLTILLMPSLLALPCPAATRHANEFGAHAGDSSDDTQALRQAFAALVDGDTLVLETGIYIVSGGFFLEGLEDIRIVGRNSEFLMKGFSRSHGNGAFTLFRLRGCRNVIVRGVQVEMDPLAHTEGTVLAVNAKQAHFDMEVLPAYRPVRGDEKIHAMMNHFPDGVPRGTFDYVRGTAERVSDSVLRVHTPKAKQLAPAEIIVIRHKDYFNVAFHLTDCHEVQLVDCEVWSAGGGIGAYQSSDLTFQRFHVRLRPKTRRLMSTNADGMHFTYCHGKLSFLDCELTGHGDDAINFHGFFMKVTSVSPDRKELDFAHIARGNLIRGYASPGDSVLLYDATLLPVGETRVLSASQDNNRGILKVDSLPAGLVDGGYLINQKWLPEVEIRGCTIGRNRARGILLQSHKVTVENNRFYGSTGAAILVSCDIDYWFESAPTREMVIRGNRIERVNHWNCCQEGAITINTCHGGQFTRLPAGVHAGVVIEGNQISQTDYAGIYLGSTDGFRIQNNRIGKWGQNPRSRPWGKAAVYVQNARNGRIAGNRVVGDGDAYAHKNTERVVYRADVN